ncbi:unnamed protein product, partial [marine sediment metagenome]
IPPFSLPAQQNIWLWTGGEWKEALCDAAGKLKISDEDPFTIAQAVPSDLRHLPYGFYAAVPAYKPYAVDSEGRLDINLHGLYSEGARVYNDADISINDNAPTELTFNRERYDTDTIHSTTVNPSRLTCMTAGKYLIVGQALFVANAAGRRAFVIRLNGTTDIAAYRAGLDSTNNVDVTITTVYDLATTDYVEFRVYQNSGVALAIVAAPNESPEFMMQRIGQ